MPTSVHLFLFHFFVPTVARLQAEQEDVAKIQTQDEALLKKEDVVLLAHIQSSVSAFKLERAGKTENGDKTSISNIKIISLCISHILAITLSLKQAQLIQAGN